jgi:hypothetical protein
MARSRATSKKRSIEKRSTRRKAAHVETSVSIEGADRDPLGALRGLAGSMRGVQRIVPDVVKLARDQRYTWAEIGDALGITRQSAWERFNGE